MGICRAASARGRASHSLGAAPRYGLVRLRPIPGVQSAGAFSDAAPATALTNSKTDGLHLRRHRTAAAETVHREGVPGLLHVRHSRPRPAAYRRRPEAGAAAHHLRHVRAGSVGRVQAQEVGAHRRRRAGQVPSARRHRLLRGHGADGAALLLPLSAGRRPGQLGLAGRPQVLCRHALHRGAADRPMPRCCCRSWARARWTGCPISTAPWTSRRVLPARLPNVLLNGATGHRRGHGHRRPAAQPARGGRRLHPPAGATQGRRWTSCASTSTGRTIPPRPRSSPRRRDLRTMYETGNGSVRMRGPLRARER